MLAHSIKPILELVPEALELIKQASVDQDYPLDNCDSTIASALELKYHEYIDHKPVDIFAIEKIATAVRLYGVEDKVNSLTDKMIKEASYREQAEFLAKSRRIDCIEKQASFSGNLSGFVDLVDVASQAVALYKEAQEFGIDPSESVLRYSGHGFLDKKASVEALAARYQATNNANFVKIASSLYKMDTFDLKPETVFDICKTVSEMDKEAKLSSRGFNFFREALLVKSAASVLQIQLCGKSYPYESIQKLGRDRISQYIGEDVAKECDSDPMSTKQVLETLPRDLQQLLCNLLKNV